MPEVVEHAVFDDTPCVMELIDPSGQLPHESRLSIGAGWREHDDFSTTMTDTPSVYWDDGYQIRYWPLVATPEFPETDVMLGRLPADMNNGVVILRRINGDDAWLAYRRRCPLPIDLMEAGVREKVEMPQLEAMIDEEGYVISLLLMSEVGAYLRFSGAWWLVPPAVNPSPIAGNRIVPVEDTAIDVYDPADMAGEMISIASLPVIGDIDVASLVRVAPESTSEADAMTAAATLLSVRRKSVLHPIKTKDDLPEAIRAAVDDPTWRWYIEKRVQALGVEDVQLPWKSEDV